MMPRRRDFVAVVALAIAMPATANPGSPLVEVWKSPDCGCCMDWVKHLESSGFAVKVFDSGNTEMRARLGMPPKYGSCHTARIAGCAIEGHVPAREIRRLLKDRPTAVGLAVPGMPIGSPGMDGPAYGSRRDPYDVLLVHKNGSSSVFASYH